MIRARSLLLALLLVIMLISGLFAWNNARAQACERTGGITLTGPLGFYRDCARW